MNEPSLRKFGATVRPGEWILYNVDELPADCAPEKVHALALAFTRVADELGDARITNVVMLGAVLGIAPEIPQAVLTPH